MTGSSPATISLARALHAAGNDVIGADYTRFPFLPPARFSNAFKSFQNLYKQRKFQRPQKTMAFAILGIRIELSVPNLFSGKASAQSGYSQDIIGLIQKERPDLWIPPTLSHSQSVGNHTTRAIGSVQQRALCNILHADVDTTEMLTDESAFAEYVEQLETGIRVPDSRIVASRDEVHRVLMACPDSKWELEDLSQSVASSETANDNDYVHSGGTDKRRWTWPVPPNPRKKFLDDTHGQDAKNVPMMSSGKVVLPLHSKNATYHCIAGMLISPDHPWTMREVVTGQSITAHLLVVRNRLRSVIASLPRENPLFGTNEHELVPTSSLLHKPITMFAEIFAINLPEDTTTFLSINFIVAGTATTMGTINTLFPTSCFVGIHPAAAILAIGSPYQTEIIVQAITEAANLRYSYNYEKEKRAEAANNAVALVPAINDAANLAGARGVYSFYPSLLTLVLLPLLDIFTRAGSFKAFYEGVLILGEKVLMWQDDIFSMRDPWPWWWEWHVRVPLDYLAGRFFPGYAL
jgi:hypothetical protein